MSPLPKPLEDLRLALEETKDALDALEKENVRILKENATLQERVLLLQVQLATLGAKPAGTDGTA